MRNYKDSRVSSLSHFECHGENERKLGTCASATLESRSCARTSPANVRTDNSVFDELRVVRRAQRRRRKHFELSSSTVVEVEEDVEEDIFVVVLVEFPFEEAYITVVQ